MAFRLLDHMPIPGKTKKVRGVSLNPESFYGRKEYGAGGPSRLERNNAGSYAAEGMNNAIGTWGRPGATADWGTIDAASLDPFPRGGTVTPESQIAANAASAAAPNPALDGFVSSPESGYQPQPSVGNTGIKTFGTTASDEYYFNLIDALSGNQYNRELLGQGLAYGLDTADRNRVRGERPIWDRLNQRNVVNSGIADQTWGEFESDQLRSIGDMLRQYDLSAQQLNIGGDLAQEQQYYRGIDSDALADALNVAATTGNISDPNELRASIAQQIRSLG
jgi:hypothetical protein